MTFQPGHSGNPAGRAVGSRNKKTLAVEAALFEHEQELVENLVERARNGEPAAMRLCMERILPVGRGRPLPIELPPIKRVDDAYVAAGIIMDALKEGALAAREAVDLLRVVEGLTRLTGTVAMVKKVARREVAKVAATLGLEHFFAGPPAKGRSKAADATADDADAAWEHWDANADAADAEDADVTEEERVRRALGLDGATIPADGAPAPNGVDSGRADDG